MPELPDLTIYIEALQRHILGARLTGWTKRIPAATGDTFPEKVTTALKRKYSSEIDTLLRRGGGGHR